MFNMPVPKVVAELFSLASSMEVHPSLSLSLGLCVSQCCRWRGVTQMRCSMTLVQKR